ncbi:MAG: hypothetical protein HKN05_07400 [Rhizobiales bacterium]|nr:hypothetical protein [Hyphomicrobiales bacterium]
MLVVCLFLLPAVGGAAAAEPGRGVQKLAQLTFCVPPMVWSKKRKRCVNPFVKTRVRCKEPRIWSAKQKRCVFPVVDNPRCGRREVFSEAKDACVCRNGYERAGKTCVRAAQAQNTGPDLAEIQACLNDLGYPAGAVDGRPGQRTRGAWNDFREDTGLGGPIRSFNDAKTLDRLFKECDAKTARKADAPDAKPEAESEDVSEPEAAEQAEAAAGAYPDVICVSKSLHKQISKLVGKKAKLDLCGEACVPIPPGTPEAQLKQSEQEYSVKWCRNCIRIGKSGLVCGQNQ